MKKVTVKSYAKKIGVSVQSVYAAIGRGSLKSVKENGRIFVIPSKKRPALLTDEEKVLERLKSEVLLKSLIIEAKNETIAAKDEELRSIKTVYTNLLELYREQKQMARKRDEIEGVEYKNRVEAVALPEGYIRIGAKEFSVRMQKKGLALEVLKELIIRNIIEGVFDFIDQELVIPEAYINDFVLK